ncbi:MAG TPA: hypothetical protein DCS93_23995 [Microscillaceae bacterium]|nr:hypothetical protein [Microscillaceae bacterium]
MGNFLKNNDQLADTMQTHLIDDLDAYGIWNDDYHAFYEKRVNAISQQLASFIIVQETEGEQEQYEDVEEEVVE